METDNAQWSTPPSLLSYDLIKNILSNNPSLETMRICFESLRRSLSKCKNPPADEVIEAGLLIPLVQALSFQFEAAWALTNIASGTPAQVTAVAEAGAVRPLVTLLLHPSRNVAGQALWAVANIIGGSTSPSEFVLDQGLLQALVELINKLDTLKVSFARTLAFAYLNICRTNPDAPIDVLRVLSEGCAKLLAHEDRQVRREPVGPFVFCLIVPMRNPCW